MSTDEQRRGVTIVVPIYGDLPSLVDCVRSLHETVDAGRDRVLLLNDCGPDADEIESTLLALTAGWTGFSYGRNPRNLGFVRTCNRAAFEVDDTDNDLLFLNSDTVCTPGFVDELAAVLHLAETHGAVCPRSNDATIASLPYTLRDPTAERSIERSGAVFDKLRGDLPRFSLAPVAVGFCIIIRRELVRRFGLFDETFSPGYGEENDFCLRIAAQGFVSVISHHAVVYHATGRSFSRSARTRLQAAHQAILIRRFPRFPVEVSDYLWMQRDAVDVFADALVPGDDIATVLIDLEWDEKAGATTWHTAVMEAANAWAAGNPVRVTVAVPDRDARRMAKRLPQVTVVHQSRLEGIWDVALASTTRPALSQLARLNRCALRWVFDDSVPADWSRLADGSVDPKTSSASSAISSLVGEWSRSRVDTVRLRERWTKLTAPPWIPNTGTAPGESRFVRMRRAIARRTPSGLVGLAARARR